MIVMMGDDDDDDDRIMMDGRLTFVLEAGSTSQRDSIFTINRI